MKVPNLVPIEAGIYKICIPQNVMIVCIFKVYNRICFGVQRISSISREKDYKVITIDYLPSLIINEQTSNQVYSNVSQIY